MPSFKYAVMKFNEKLATIGTTAFGNMWAFYLFFVWGLLGMMPFLPKQFTELVLLVSSAWIQLWALPLLAVGNSVMNKASEKRAKEDHQMIKIEFAEIKEMQIDHEIVMDKLNNIESILKTLHKMPK